MPERNRKLFAYNDMVISYRYHKGVFEVQYRRRGIRIYAAASNFNEMKKRFIQKISNFNPTFQSVQMPADTPQSYSSPVNSGKNLNDVLFTYYVDQWLEKKQLTVKERTYKEYENLAFRNNAEARQKVCRTFIKRQRQAGFSLVCLFFFRIYLIPLNKEIIRTISLSGKSSNYYNLAGAK